MNKYEKTKKIVLLGLMTAVTVVVTMFIAIPIPNINGAYINAGDAAVYISAYLLGGTFGAAAGGIGSALADLFLGSAIYAPGTLVIKALMAFVTGLLLKKLKGNAKILALIAGGLVMSAGYCLYEGILYGFPTAVAGLPFNLIQCAGGIIIGAVVIKALELLLEKNSQKI